MDRNESLGLSDNENEEEDNYDSSATWQQLQILQSLIPNCKNKTDPRSILEDASDYVHRIQQQMEEIEKELSETTEENGSSSRSSSSCSGSISSEPKILRVVTEKLVGDRFVVKISSKKGPGVAAQVQRVFESLELDVKMTSISVQENTPFEMLTTAIVEVTRNNLTEEELHDLITRGAKKLGLVQV